ncbi:MAG: cytochrome c biogenesis protein CcsA [Spirochaetes bacterium]|nr:cytochrome c biogenesis protein CcsA [Spirochaetota bacterium]
MFTTNNNIYLYIAAGCFAASFALYLLKARASGLFALIAGFCLYSLYLAGRAWIPGMFLPNPMVEGPYLLPWCIGVIALVMAVGRHERWGIALVPLLLFTAFALVYARGIIPPTPNKLTPWLVAFFVPEVFAHACFYCGAVFAAILLAGRDRTETFHKLLVWGFVLYSVAQVTGAIWCFLGWGNTFQWGPRHMSSAATWLIFAAYLHLKYIPGWNVRRRAWFAIAAALVVLAVTNSSYLHEMNFPRIGG